MFPSGGARLFMKLVTFHGRSREDRIGAIVADGTIVDLNAAYALYLRNIQNEGAHPPVHKTHPRLERRVRVVSAEYSKRGCVLCTGGCACSGEHARLVRERRSGVGCGAHGARLCSERGRGGGTVGRIAALSEK